MISESEKMLVKVLEEEKSEFDSKRQLHYFSIAALFPSAEHLPQAAANF